MLTVLCDGLFVLRSHMRKRSQCFLVLMISSQLFLLVSQRWLYGVAHWLSSLLQISSMAVWLAWLTYTSITTWQQLKVEDALEYNTAAAAALRRRKDTGESDVDEDELGWEDEELNGFIGGSHMPFVLSFDNDTHRNTLSSIRSGLGDAREDVGIDLFDEQDRMNGQDAGGLYAFKQRVYKMVTRAVFLYPTLVVILYTLFLLFAHDSYKWMWLRLVVFDVWMFMVVVPASWHWLPHSSSARYTPLMEHMPAAAPVMEMASITTARAQEAASSAASKLAAGGTSSGKGNGGAAPNSNFVIGGDGDICSGDLEDDDDGRQHDDDDDDEEEDQMIV